MVQLKTFGRRKNKKQEKTAQNKRSKTRESKGLRSFWKGKNENDTDIAPFTQEANQSGNHDKRRVNIIKYHPAGVEKTLMPALPATGKGEKKGRQDSSCQKHLKEVPLDSRRKGQPTPKLEGASNQSMQLRQDKTRKGTTAVFEPEGTQSGSIFHRQPCPIVSRFPSSAIFHFQTFSIVRHFPLSDIFYCQTFSNVSHFLASAIF